MILHPPTTGQIVFLAIEHYTGAGTQRLQVSYTAPECDFKFKRGVERAAGLHALIW